MSRKVKDAMKSSEMSLTEEETTDSSETSLTEEEETTKSTKTSLAEEEAMSLLCFLSEAKKMKVPVKRRKRRAVGLASTGAFVGGPPGLAVGSAVGGLAGALVWSMKFKLVSQILKELPPAEQEKLCRQVSVVIEDLEWTDTKHLTELVMGNKALQKQLLKLLEDYITRELRTTVKSERREISGKVKDATKSSEMPLRVEDTMKLLSDVWNAEMKAAFKHVKQSLLVTGAMMIFGAMVWGPLGLAAGGTVGGFLSFWMSRGKFKSVPQILKELPPAEKEQLHRQVRYIVRNLEWTDVVQLTKKVMANKAVQKQLLTLLMSYVK